MVITNFSNHQRDGLVTKLKGTIEDKYWCILKNYYENSTGKLKINGITDANSFKINKGVKQGGILSPFLFNFYINDLIKEISALNTGLKYDTYGISVLGYCDDLLLISNSIYHLQQLIHICEVYSSKWRLKFNAKKCAILNASHKSYQNEQINIYLNKTKSFINNLLLFYQTPAKDSNQFAYFN